jgi:hypothetical protein
MMKSSLTKFRLQGVSVNPAPGQPNQALLNLEDILAQLRQAMQIVNQFINQ